MNITFVTNDDDWEGMYIDGKLVAEDHVLSARDVLRALSIFTDTVRCDWDWLDCEMSLPENLEDVVRDE